MELTPISLFIISSLLFLVPYYFVLGYLTGKLSSDTFILYLEFFLKASIRKLSSLFTNLCGQLLVQRHLRTLGVQGWIWFFRKMTRAAARRTGFCHGGPTAKAQTTSVTFFHLINYSVNIYLAPAVYYTMP